MARFILFLYRIVNYYLYFVVMACFLSLVPNINPNYPLFNMIFKIAGFYLIPPVFGFIISPMIILILLALIMMGLSKIYLKQNISSEPKVVFMTPEDFMKEIIKKQKEYDKKIKQDEIIKSEEKSEREDEEK